MERRNFLMNLVFGVLSFFLGFISGKGGIKSFYKTEWLKVIEKDQVSKVDIYTHSGVSLESYRHLVLNIGTSKEDWEPAIKMAIKDIKLLGGGDVFFPFGRKRITKEVYISSNVRFIGVGEGSEIWTDVPKINLIVSEVNAVGCEVIGLKITGSGFGNQPVNSDVNQNVTNAGSGIIFRGVSKGVIKNCFISNHGGDRSTSNKNGVAGIWLTYGCEDCFIVENHVTNCRNGINEDNYFHRDAKNNTIQSNYVSNCIFGIATENDNGKGCKILNNTVKFCTYGAVDVNRSSYVLIQGNVFEGNGLTGEIGIFSATITCYGSSSIKQKHVSIEGNHFIDSQGFGVKIAQNNYYSTVNQNKIIGGLNSGGVLVQGARFYSISNNQIVGCNGSGIYANEVSVNGKSLPVDGCDISNNLITSCTENGIYLNKSGKMTVSKNRITDCGTKADNTYSGIVFTNGTSNGIIDGNIVDGAKLRYGIVGLDSRSVNNIVSNNLVITVPMIAKYGFDGKQIEINNN
ncbi:right-handed parallel beta-helix repeat-containing protein [Neobacillus vireti]|uniref:right-handed parallel beta-helix repeat-containing protein n=1 Tax=Neobacillus vireti TaxID=220686 RepID=UPI002FFDF382